jgi:hypothetical protein
MNKPGSFKVGCMASSFLLLGFAWVGWGKYYGGTAFATWVLFSIYSFFLLVPSLFFWVVAILAFLLCCSLACGIVAPCQQGGCGLLFHFSTGIMQLLASLLFFPCCVLNVLCLPACMPVCLPACLPACLLPSFLPSFFACRPLCLHGALA